MNLRIEDNLSMMDPFMSSISTLDLPPFWPTPSSSAACHVSPSHPTQETSSTASKPSSSTPTSRGPTPMAVLPRCRLRRRPPRLRRRLLQRRGPRRRRPRSNLAMSSRRPANSRFGHTQEWVPHSSSSSFSYPFFLSIIIISSSIMNVVIVTWQVEGGTSPERLRGWRLMEGLLEEWVQVMPVGVCGDQLEKQLVSSVMED